jgi:hypothetical protein
MGYSIGTWDKDTLVVQTTGFNKEGWLDNVGHPRGQSMLITERFRRRDFGHIDLEIRVLGLPNSSSHFTIAPAA